MYLHLLHLICLFIILFPRKGYSQSEAWAISGSFTKIATDDAGNLYVVSDNVLTKYDTLGNALWSKTYAAPIESLTAGRDSAMYIAGFFASPIQLDNQILLPYKFSNIFLAKLNGSGDVQWVRQISGSQAIRELQFASDSKGNIYFSGVAQSTSFFVDSIYVGQVAGYAIFVQKFSRDGTFKFQKGLLQVGISPNWTSLNTISVDRQDNLHVFYESPNTNSSTIPPGFFNAQSRTWFDSTGLLLGHENDLTEGNRITYKGYKARNNPFDYLFTKISTWLFNVERTILPNCSGGNDCYNNPPINPDYDDFDNTYYAGYYPMFSGYFPCSSPLPQLYFSCTNTGPSPSGPFRNIYVIINDTLISPQKDSLIDVYPVWLAADPNGKSLYLLAGWNSYFSHPALRFGNSMLTEPGSMVLRYRIDKTYPLVANAGEDKTICLGGKTMIGASKLAKGGMAPYSYQWWPETGLDNAKSPNPTVSPSSTTEYIVTVADTAGTLVTDTVKVVVDSTLKQPIIEVLSGENPFCEGDTLFLKASDALAYNWSNGSKTQSIKLFSNDSLIVSTVSVEGCRGTSEPFVAKMKLRPSTPTILPDSAVSFCAGDFAILTASTNQGAASYKWNTGDTTSAITISKPGNYALTAKGTNGCLSLPVTKEVTVNPLPVGTIIVNGKENICQGDSVLLIIQSPSAAAYIWNSGATTQSIWVRQSGTYAAQLITAQGCKDSASNTVTATVSALPVPVITQDGNELSVFPAASSYQWYLNATAINGATTQTITISRGGNYRILITDSNGCQGTTSAAAVLRLENKFISYQVYPNPVNGELNIVYTLKRQEKVTIKIYDAFGRQRLLLVNNALQTAGDHLYRLKSDMLQLQKGVYLIGIYVGSHKVVQKFVVL